MGHVLQGHPRRVLPPRNNDTHLEPIEVVCSRYGFVADGGVVSGYYHAAMAMTLRLTEEDQDALRERAALDGMSMEETVRQAVREYIANADHRDQVAAAAERVQQHHAVALDRLGE